MSVLVTTTDGYHVFTSNGQDLHALAGHRVEALAPAPNGAWLAIIDRRAIWRLGCDSEWAPLAQSDADLTAVVSVGDTVFAGTADARVLRVSDAGALELLPRSTPYRVGHRGTGSVLRSGCVP